MILEGPSAGGEASAGSSPLCPGASPPRKRVPLAHFIHIPKTGGHTLEAIFVQQYGPEALFFSGWGRGFGGPSDGPVGVWLQTERDSTKGRFFHPEHLNDFARRFEESPAAERELTRLLYGKNLEWGLEEHLGRPLNVFTVLREPVDRVLSQYFFTVEYGAKPPHLSLYEHIAAHIQPNIQTRLLSGPHGLSPQPPGDKMLQRAKENLRSCCAVGLTERFGETVLLFGRALGWGEVAYERRRVNKTRPRMNEVPVDVVHRLADDNRLDVELYGYARTLFQDQCAAYGPDFQQDYMELGRRNQAFRAAAKTARQRI